MDKVKRVLAQGEQLDWKGEAWKDYPLMVASFYGQAAAAEQLLSSGANANACSHSGETPLLLASKSRDCDTVSTLLKHGADINVRSSSGDLCGFTPLMLAAYMGCVPVVRLLLENGAEPWTMNNEWETALDLAGKGCVNEEASVAVIEMLQEWML